jgi:hypothetical protein
MGPDQIDLLIHAIEGAARILGWTIGLSTTAFLIILGWTVTALFRSWSKRIDEADAKAGTAMSASADLAKLMSDAATNCQEMRASCREGLIKDLADRPRAKEVKILDVEQRKLLEQSINALQALVMQQTETLESTITQFKEENGKFKDTFWDAFHKHAHADDGSVIRK